MPPPDITRSPTSTAPPTPQSIGADYARYASNYPKAGYALTNLLREIEDYRVFAHLSGGDSKAHAKEFESATGVTGIAKNYILPPGTDATRIEAALKSRRLLPVLLQLAIDRPNFSPYQPDSQFGHIKFPPVPPGTPLHDAVTDIIKKTTAENLSVFNRQFDELVALNPELTQLRLDRRNPVQVYDAIRGTASGYNVDDQNYWLNRPKTAPADYERRLAEIKVLTGEELKWRPSPQTLDKISSQLGLGKQVSTRGPMPNKGDFDWSKRVAGEVQHGNTPPGKHRR